MKNEENDDLWLLLGEARKPVVSPFFSRDVLRAIRQEQQEKPEPTGFFGWLLRQRASFAVLSVLAVASLSVSAWHQLDRRQKISDIAQALSASPDYAVISHLDELLAYEENSAWLDQTGY